MNGIDISKHNNLKENDFKILKSNGIDFVILRAGYGRLKSQEDPLFRNYYKWSKNVGLKVGCYWYSYAMNVAEMLEEVKAFREVIKDLIFEMPVFLDFEEEKQFKLPKYTINKMIKTFLDDMESKGYWVGLYMSRWYLENYIDEDIRNRYCLWVADYSKKIKYKGNYGIWQYTDKGRFKGINCNFDLDRCSINYPVLIKNKKLNGYQFIKTSEQIINEILNGYFGNGEIRKKLLKDLGYNPTAIQILINERLKNEKN